jgi:sugar lactone lactonase YvrE
MRTALAVLLLAESASAAWLVALKDRGVVWYGAEGAQQQIGPGRLIAFSSDRRLLYTAGDRLSIFRRDTWEPLGSVAFPAGFYADAMAVSQNSGVIAVAGSGRALLIDPRKHSILREVSTEGRHPHAVAFADRVYVSNGGSETLAQIDPNSGRTEMMKVRGTPAAMALSPDAKELYAANAGAGGITIVDLDRRLAKAHIATCSRPDAVALIRARRRLVYLCRGENRIEIADITRRAPIDYVLLPEEPTCLALAPDGKTVAVCSPAGLLYIISVEQKKIVDRLKTGAPSVAVLPVS